MANKPTCMACTYFRPFPVGGRPGAEGQGECRLKAPVIRLGRHGERDRAMWPPVWREDWCGRFEAEGAA